MPEIIGRRFSGPPYDGRQVAEALFASMRRRGMNEQQAAEALYTSVQFLRDYLSGIKRIPPAFIDSWCRLVEPRQDNLLWVQLNYLCAAADGWDLTYDKNEILGTLQYLGAILDRASETVLSSGHGDEEERHPDAGTGMVEAS